MKPRRHARCLTLEILYECDLAEHDSLAVLQKRAEDNSTIVDYLKSEQIDVEGDEEQEEIPEQFSEHTLEFAENLLRGIDDYLPSINTLITRYAPEWPLEQIAVIDRNILRIAIYEVLIDQNTPIKVAINEAVELAKMYGSDSAPRFVNGVLGTLTEKVDELRLELLGEPVTT